MFQKKSLTKTVAPGEDDLGPYPAEIDDSPTRDKALSKALRATSMVAIVSGCMNIAFVMMFVTIFPLQKVQPYLVKFKSQDDQVVQIEPISVEAPAINYITEDNVRDYVIQRHRFTPDKETMDAQWGKTSRLAARTASPLFSEFEKAAEAEMKTMMSQGYKREITINSVSKIEGNVWRVEFTTEDSLGGYGGTLSANPAFANTSNAVPADPTQMISATTVPAVNKKEWVATMRINYLPQTVTYDKRLLNPLGFTVEAYSVTSKG